MIESDSIEYISVIESDSIEYISVIESESTWNYECIFLNQEGEKGPLRALDFSNSGTMISFFFLSFFLLFYFIFYIKQRSHAMEKLIEVPHMDNNTIREV